MGKTISKTTTYIKGRPLESIAIVGLGIGFIYLLTKNNNPAAGGGNKSVIEKITEKISSTVAEGAGNVVGSVVRMPAEIVTGTVKKVYNDSVAKTDTDVFQNQPRSNVSAFLATGSKKGDVFKNPVTYTEFINAQPLAFKASVATGNLITADASSSYGAMVASETKKGLAAQGVSERRLQEQYTHQSAYGQALTGLGQAITVPFGGGGAMAWGASLTNWWNR